MTSATPVLGQGLRVGGPGTPPFGARGMSSIRYGTWLGDLKNKQPTHTPQNRLFRVPAKKHTTVFYLYTALRFRENDSEFWFSVNLYIREFPENPRNRFQYKG